MIRGTIDFAAPETRGAEANWVYHHQQMKICPRCKRLYDIEILITDEATTCRDCRNEIRAEMVQTMRRVNEMLAERAALQAEVDRIARNILRQDRKTALDLTLDTSAQS